MPTWPLWSLWAKPPAYLISSGNEVVDTYSGYLVIRCFVCRGHMFLNWCCLFLWVFTMSAGCWPIAWRDQSLGPVFLAQIHILFSPSSNCCHYCHWLPVEDGANQADGLSRWGAPASRRQGVVKIVLWFYGQPQEIYLVSCLLFGFCLGIFWKPFFFSPLTRICRLNDLSGLLKSRSRGPPGTLALFSFTSRLLSVLLLYCFYCCLNSSERTRLRVQIMPRIH